MIDTVRPTAEAAGRFQRQRRDHFQSVQLAPESELQSGRPVSRPIRRSLRDPFPGNIDPAEPAESARCADAAQYVPRPNSMDDMGMGMTMMGAAHRLRRRATRTRTISWIVREHAACHQPGHGARGPRLRTRRHSERPLLGRRRKTASCRRTCPGSDFNHDNCRAERARSSGRA